MPYIGQENREKLIPKIELYAQNAGELNFQLTSVVIEYLKHNGRTYKQINDIVGALEACKLEFYRRIVSHYEDKKIGENGDVY